MDITFVHTNPSCSLLSKTKRVYLPGTHIDMHASAHVHTHTYVYVYTHTLAHLSVPLSRSQVLESEPSSWKRDWFPLSLASHKMAIHLGVNEIQHMGPGQSWLLLDEIF